MTEGSFAGAKIGGTVQARFSPDVAITGSLDLEEASLPYLVSLAAGAEPGLEAARWTDKPFAATFPDGISANLALTADTLDVGTSEPATVAKLNLALSSNRLQVDLAEAGFAGGVLKGALSATVLEGDAQMSLRGALQGGELEAFVWEDAGLPAASGRLDLSFDVVGRGGTMAEIVGTLGGSGSFAVDGGRFNSLNGAALAAVMAAAEGSEEPDEEEARQTFTRLFGSGALEFGHAAGSFSVSDGVVSVPTVSVEGDGTAILAGAAIDLKALSLASDWVVRTSGEGEEAQPFVNVRFAGPIAAPEREVDLAPLLSRLQSSFLQQQVEELEEAARERAEFERQQAARERQEAADRRDVEEPAPPARPRAARRPPPAAVEIGPDLPPPAPVRQRRAAPIQLVPPPPQEPPPPPQPQYRTLPNGTIVKIR
jgi:hypothetical protein